jgi:selenocysteine lyase/cysteine desulfurase
VTNIQISEFRCLTGIGALVISKALLRTMSSSSFSGGTAKAVHLPSFEFVPEEGHAVFERGTFNLLAMSAIPLGLGCIRKRLSAIRARNALFMKYLAEQLPVIRYNDAMAGRMVES